MKKTYSTLLLSLFATLLYADEGMWLVNNITGALFAQMKQKGLALAPEQIYNVNGNSLKDAIIAIDGGSCSGSIISSNGLMITNHHCAYSDIHALSTPEKNYLEDGFWAMTQDREIPIKEKSVTFLKKVIDVTKDAQLIIDSLDQLGTRGIFFFNRVERALLQKYGLDPKEQEVSLASMWRGNSFYLYFLETYQDVRLVGAPPVSIGAFGGEQDNWKWPQHKGDFALYRVYMSPDGKPAKYHEENIPYSTSNFLRVSSKGVKEGDFTMILGYPYRINRYVPSAEVQEKFDILNPIISTVRRLKLETLKSKMDANPEIRLKYQDKYFSISNYCDYAKWENICIQKQNVIGIRQKEEEELSAFLLRGNPDKTQNNGGNTLLLDNIAAYYTSVKEVVKNKEMVRETIVRGSEWLVYAQRLNSLINGLKRKGEHNVLDMNIPEVANFVKFNYKSIFLLADPDVEREVFITMFTYLISHVNENYFSDELKTTLQKYDRNLAVYADYLYQNSILTNPTRFMRFFTSTRSFEEALADPMMDLVSFQNLVAFNKQEEEINKESGLSISSLKIQYVTELYAMRQAKGMALYPDANSTMRLTYGTVGSLKPADAIYYDWYSTSAGVMEKVDPNDYDFHLKSDFAPLLESGKWGRWGNSKGQLPINFLSNNDITGGNSGSPVLNAKGELIGLAFDGNRDSMSGDLYFDPKLNKCVSVDIRYVLWIIQNYAKADYLLNEITIL